MAKDWKNVVCHNCGLINDYNITVKNSQQVCKCNGCDTYLGNKPRTDVVLRDMSLPFGKHKGKLVFEIDDNNYLLWLLNNTNISGSLKRSIELRVHGKVISKI